MAEAVISVPAEIAAKHAVDSIATQVGYFCNYKTNFENLDKQLKNLKCRRDAVQHAVEEATRNGDEIEQQVVNWLDSMNKMIDEAAEIIDHNKRVNMLCFKSLCPDFKNRYQQSKKAARKTDDVSELYDEGTFARVSFRTLPAETWHPDGYEYFKSRQSTLESILNALRDHDVNMVGVYGMGGSGKTTLVREVAKMVEEDKLFNKAVFAEVSDTVDIRKIQGVIAERLGLEFHEDTEPVRADRLRNRIMQESKILLILDNIWKDLDLAAVGIPFGNNHVGCKLLLTSRDMDLLNEMGSKTNFFVDILEEEEARNLFMKIAGVGEEKRDLRSLAFEVAKECEGLLVAIITVANALKNKQECEWRIALRELSNPPSLENVEGSVVKKAYACIHLSYKKLESEELKSTFLLCSTMGCTQDASIEVLLRYAVGLSLFKEENTIEEVRDKAKKLVRKLKDSSLILGTRNSETFSIHDVVRDVGRWIANKDQHKFTVINNVIPRHWAGENTLENCTSISLHDIAQLPKPLQCPKLKFFYMKTKTRFTKIPDNFFKGMPNLMVLHLIEMDLSPLPASLCLLKNLCTLNLDECRLGDIAEIKGMENLEILVIGFDYNTKQLPKEIGQLTRLRFLDLRNCSFVIPPNTISKLTQLEELYMGYWYDQQRVEELFIENSVASLEELKNLSRLTALHIHVTNAEILPKGLVFQKLKRYKIVIGDGWNSRETSRTLHVRSETNICSEDGVIKQLKGIEDLCLDGKQRVKNVLYELDGEAFPQLKHFHIGNNPYIQFVVDSMPSATYDAFPLLDTLSLSNLVRLEKICHDQLTTKSFCRLRTIKVKKCDKLKNLFSFSIAKHLSQLQEIEVVECRNMEEIFIVDRADNGVIDSMFVNQLHSLTLKSLPRLRRICSEATSQERRMLLTTDASSSKIISEDQLDALPLFTENVVFPNLKNLHLHEINGKNQLPSLFRWVQSFTSLIVKNCSNLKYLFSSSTLGSFKQLQHLQIHNCKDLEELIRIDDNCSNYVEFPSLEKLHIGSCPELREFIFSDKVSFPSLQEIRINYMENLKTIWQNQLIESVRYCPKLSKVSLYDCQNLGSLFPASIAKSLLQLEELIVNSCGIKEIVAKEGVEESAARFIFPQLTSLHFYNLENLRCFYPDNHTTEWPKLNELKVRCCEKIDLFNFRKNDEEGQLDVRGQQPLFLVDLAFSNLENLTISRNHIKMIWQSQFPVHLFPKLQFLKVRDDESSFLPLGILERFHNFKKLKLKSSWYKEIFLYEEIKKHAETFRQIKSLYLSGLRNLKQIWKEDSKMDLILQKLEFLEVASCRSLIILMPPSACFENLKVLKVAHCDRLLSLVAASTTKSLMRLEELSICDCQEMTEIIANEGDEMEGEIVFSNLKSLELERLTNLTSFCSVSYTFNFPMLEKLTMEECPNMKFFSLGVLSTPNLQEVSQDSTNYYCECPNLNTIIKEHHEKKIFSILQESFLNGQDIRLVWQIFPERQKEFANLKRLSLSGNDIRMIWQSQFPEHTFPVLKCLSVSRDESVVFPLGIFQIFHNIEKLELRSSSYEEIFSYEEVEKYAGVLAKIKCLHLKFLGDIKHMWKKDSKLDLILRSVEILQVERCQSLTNILLPSSSFVNLKILKVKDCKRLKSLVAASTAKSLVRLEEMQICRCKMMKEVVPNEGDVKEDEIIFHKLKKLDLNDLSSLTSFSFGNYTLKFPFLEKLTVKECSNMKIFSSEDLSTPILREVWLDQMEYICENDLNKILQQHHEEMVFSRKELNFDNIRMILQTFPGYQKVFSNLEQLSFSRDEIRMIWQNQFPQKHLVPKVKLLEVSEDESTVFPHAILQRFHNVEKLELNCCSYEEIFSCEDVEKLEGMLAQIKSLSLYRLNDLKQMWKQDSKLDLILQNLEIVQVNWCGSLVSLIPPSASFRNLTNLSVEGCDRLMSLVAPSTAKSLVQLQQMTIKKCNMMTEVISSNEGVVTGDEIILKNLWSLHLDSLSSLTSFCSGNYSFNFPRLYILTLKKCPKIKFFSSGVMNTPELQHIRHDGTNYIWDGDLNAIIQGIHEKLNAKTSPEDCGGLALFPSSASSSTI
ncbi:hypothetical protein ACOSQ2_021743 [Xanthoceras sorbifolium]